MIETAKLNNIYFRTILLCLLAIGLFILINPGYLILDLFMVAGILSLPATFKILTTSQSQRFFWPTIAITLLSIVLRSTFGAYCSMIFFLLLVIEMYIGKLSLLTLFHLLLLSPLFKYFSSLVSFPLRMQIANITAGMFQLAGMDIELSGNLITFSGTEFLVDKACMGLHMLGYSFLFGLIILARIEKGGRKLSFRSITLFMILLLALNFISNLSRAFTLILFKVMPESWLHDVVGLLAFTLYVLLPFYLISKWWCKQQKIQDDKPIRKLTHVNLRLSITLLLYILSVGLGPGAETLNQDPPVANLTGFNRTELENHVVKLTNEEALIYIKPPVAPYKADHNPLICWQGSGYSFKKINYIDFGGHKVHFAELVKGDDKLYSAWWFQSMDTITSDQWAWRWDAIAKNRQYSMVNVTCATVEELEFNSLNFLQHTLQSKPILTKLN
ncbi:exosortase N [Fulvivirga kasyanovii]|nr:exosortase N [Fulvivirga kasyanovii]